MKIRILSAVLLVSVPAMGGTFTETTSSALPDDELVEGRFVNVSGQVISEFYSDEVNYRLVYRKVMSWYGSTSNGCVAFASTLLRLLGVNVPQNGIWNGERISLVTRPFSDYLEDKLGWQRITDPSELLPGDFVFTVDEPKAPGYPAHVFVHSGYADSNRLYSLAIDNQGFTHSRALGGDVRKDYSAFAYALRSPM